MEYYLLYRYTFLCLVIILHDHKTDQALLNLIHNASNATVIIPQDAINKTNSSTGNSIYLYIFIFSLNLT